MSLVGGGARSPFWAQLLADALDTEILTHQGGEACAALGAARLGWLADGGDLGAVCVKPSPRALHAPDPARLQALQARLRHFRALYQARPPSLAETPI
ncbi:hypothetical protein B0T45_09065 [Chromobacterium haemolyticum]|uniref:Carbohydrate kinase FGGY C-terminal domain-containing protein n=1 Tax=Chromobacterium haemolyticum TaxID=394935 RepID=A0A1W0D1Z5_9NEIS|nr:hypothetical protein B0T45_09065 [Chromobacterium haemolyticum]